MTETESPQPETPVDGQREDPETPEEAPATGDGMDAPT